MRMRTSACLLLALVACQPPESRPVRRTSPDTRSLYGDPALVPTPEGERARRDLARAGDLESLLPLDEPHVVVGHPPDAPEQVLVRGRLRPEADETQVREAILTNARAIFGSEAKVGLQLVASDPPAHDRPPLDPLLWMAFIGLGASAGVALDRERRRRRPV